MAPGSNDTYSDTSNATGNDAGKTDTTSAAPAAASSIAVTSAASAGVAQPAPPPAPTEGAAPVYFDYNRHKRVQKLKNHGLPADLGPEWGNLAPILRPFSHPVVVARQEAMEQKAKNEHNLGPNDSLEILDQIQCNKVAVLMAVVGIQEGRVLVDEELTEICARFSIPVEEVPDVGKVAVFSRLENGTEVSLGIEAEACREFLRVLLRESNDFFKRLIGASQQLGKIKDEVIDSLGKDFVLGRHVVLDLAD